VYTKALVGGGGISVSLLFFPGKKKLVFTE
jgi:hypothetical protein